MYNCILHVYNVCDMYLTLLVGTRFVPFHFIQVSYLEKKAAHNVRSIHGEILFLMKMMV